ncbi:DUF2508 family protein [Clostridium sp. 'White wine YQ']|uniref:DUF2508 family protein n=1 Tax=Clostridium sp. 'White wine YQ' TaxID=3027474 RepID=UPI002365A9A1|nr:DUF2508 family protein [Clostridium sp. 'White wine YQ']MDD7796128.1 DUF2508 family protein [Clostridium sp. 'White wine YQ']
MNRKFILESLLKKKVTNEVSLIKDIEQAVKDIKVAESMFESVSDPKLIEIAIYSEEVARKRLDFLLREAKDNNSKVDNAYVVEKSSGLAE